MKRLVPLSLSCFILLASCGRTEEPRPGQSRRADTLTFADAPGGGETEAADSLPMRAQVALDRLGFSPGVIDGAQSPPYTMALRGFQEARGLPVTGTLDAVTQEALFKGQRSTATSLVIIPDAFAKGVLVPKLQAGVAEQAPSEQPGHRSLTEALAERFHTTPETLVALNGRGTRIGAGSIVRVPAIAKVAPAAAEEDGRGWMETLQKLGVAAAQPQAARVVVHTSERYLRAYDARGTLIAQFPITTGSAHDPLPSQGRSKQPGEEEINLAAGPNGPVGVARMDLPGEHHGIHGAADPQAIARREGHGCVRLTNWDAARLAQMVHTDTEVIFQA